MELTGGGTSELKKALLKKDSIRRKKTSKSINYYLYRMRYNNMLLIDDDIEDHEIFTTALQRISDTLTFISLTNAREALVKLVAKELTPEVIFLDLNMPIMSGREFLREIKTVASLSHIPVIIYSTSSNVDTIEEMKSMGASDFITKPNKFSELVSLLTLVLQPDKNGTIG